MRLILLLSLGLLISAGCEPSAKRRPAGTGRTTVPDKPFIVYDFWAEWCGPCNKFAPTFEEVQNRLDKRPDVAFVRVNFDDDKELVRRFKINSIPTVIVTAQGKEAARIQAGLFINKADGFEQELLKVLK